MITAHTLAESTTPIEGRRRWQHSQSFRTRRRARRQRRAFVSIAVMTVTVVASAASASYIVKAGDTLSNIAQKTGVSVNQLTKLNKLSNPDFIDIGQVLATEADGGQSSGSPSTSTPTTTTGPSTSERAYTVKSGDNLYRISAKYGVSIGSIVKLNNISSADGIDVGQVLRIPAAPASTATTASHVHPDLYAYPDRLVLVPIFEKWAARNGIPADLLKAMCFQESGWRANATSPSGAYGVCQIMPYEARWLARDVIGVPTLDRANAEDNIRMGARYLRILLEETGGDARLALAGYYQGLPSVMLRGMYTDTQEYVRLIIGFRAYFR